MWRLLYFSSLNFFWIMFRMDQICMWQNHILMYESSNEFCQNFKCICCILCAKMLENTLWRTWWNMVLSSKILDVQIWRFDRWWDFSQNINTQSWILCHGDPCFWCTYLFIYSCTFLSFSTGEVLKKNITYTKIQIHQMNIQILNLNRKSGRFFSH